MSNFLIQTNIPIFHHSIIPSGLHERCSNRNAVISISCTISETFNQDAEFRPGPDQKQGINPCPTQGNPFTRRKRLRCAVDCRRARAGLVAELLHIIQQGKHKKYDKHKYFFLKKGYTSASQFASLTIGMLEQWNDGIMGELVLSNVKEEKWGTGLLAEFLLTGRQ